METWYWMVEKISRREGPEEKSSQYLGMEKKTKGEDHGIWINAGN